jgi:hypothetical protein
MKSRRGKRAVARAPRHVRARRGRAATWTIALVVLAGLAGLVVQRGGLRRLPGFGGSTDARSTAGGAIDVPNLPSARAYLDAVSAANVARDYPRMTALVDEGLRRFPDDPSLLLARGAALNNASFFVESHRGRLVPALATSLERVRAAQDAIGAYDAVARRYPAIGEPVAERGLVLVTWGLPEDGRQNLERAYDLGDHRPEVLNALGVVVRTQRGEGL